MIPNRSRFTPPRDDPAPPPPPPGPARAGGRLTPRQIKALVILAREAYDEVHPAETFDAWRHAQCQRAAGVPGLSAATQRDYRAIKTHFLSLAGRAAAAFATGLTAEPELADADQAMHLLRAACERWGLALGYPAAICMRQFRVPLAKATPQQLAWLLSTINNRGRAKAGHTINHRRRTEY